MTKYLPWVQGWLRARTAVLVRERAGVCVLHTLCAWTPLPLKVCSQAICSQVCICQFIPQALGAGQPGRVTPPWMGWFQWLLEIMTLGKDRGGRSSLSTCWVPGPTLSVSYCSSQAAQRDWVLCGEWGHPFLQCPCPLATGILEWDPHAGLRVVAGGPTSQMISNTSESRPARHPFPLNGKRIT